MTLKAQNELIVDLRINETLQIGAVGNSTYQVEGESVYLFLEFTIIKSDRDYKIDLTL